MLLGIAKDSEPPRVALTWYGGWPSMEATLGDLFALENLSRALTANGIGHVVVSTLPTDTKAPIVSDFRKLRKMDVVVHVCGPLLPSKQIT